jgi:hypothetical protein
MLSVSQSNPKQNRRIIIHHRHEEKEKKVFTLLPTTDLNLKRRPNETKTSPNEFKIMSN